MARPRTDGNTSRAFTLIELLVVVVIIGLLMGLLTSAILKARENARRKQNDVEISTLNAAIWAYRHEYGRWPIPKDRDTTGTVSYAKNNYYVLDRLISKDRNKNEHQVQFINLGEYWTKDKVTKKRVLMENVWDPNRNDNDRPVINPFDYAYGIGINLDLDTVTVSNSPFLIN